MITPPVSHSRNAHPPSEAEQTSPVGRGVGLLRQSVVLLLFAAIAGCGDSAVNPSPAITVSVSPATATVGVGETQTLTATVTNTSNTGVQWSATGGSINGTGLSVSWVAPATPGQYTVTATSAADVTKSGTATLTVPPLQLSILPASPTALRGEPLALTAQIQGSSAQSGIAWTSTCGQISGTGTAAVFAAPVEPTTCTVTATASLFPGLTATTQVVVRRAIGVTSANDADDGSCNWAHCSLREAIIAANAAAGPDTLFLWPASAAPAGLPAGIASGDAAALESPALSTVVAYSSILPAAALPAITQDLAIIGAGPATTVIDMAGSPQNVRRAIEVSGGKVTLQGLTIRNAYAPAGPAALVWNGAELHTIDVVMRDNRATTADGGALYITGQGSKAVLVDTDLIGNETIAASRTGGAIALDPGTTLEMTRGTLSQNRATAAGGAIRGFTFSSISLQDTEIIGNEVLAGGSNGGGLLLMNNGATRSSVSLVGVTISGNRAPVGGGGASFQSNMDVTISKSKFSENSAGSQTGGGFIFSGTGSNLAATELELVDNNAPAAAGAYFGGTGTRTLDKSLIAGNVAGTQAGGGIFAEGSNTLRITNSTIRDNTAAAGNGGGLFAFAPVNLTVELTTVIDNSAILSGGGLWFRGPTVIDRSTIERNSAGANGGGLTAGDNTVIRNSTLVSNTAGAAGGAIFGAPTAASPIQLINSTISGNQAQRGGGVSSNFVHLVNSSVIGNEAFEAAGGAGAYASGGSNFRLTNTLLANNKGPAGSSNCGVTPAAPGTYATGGGNLSDDNTCSVLGGQDRANTPAGVSATLANNGGPTRTHALTTGSAAIGGAVQASCPTQDQRGVVRDSQCDIGAFELEGAAPPPPPVATRPHDDRVFLPPVGTGFAALAGATAYHGTYEGIEGTAGYRFEVPAQWNGILVMHAHGYNGTVLQLAMALPPAALRNHLIQNGYAWGASSFSSNYYDVRAGLEDTNELALRFQEFTGRAAPAKYYIVGVSMGGHVAGAAVELETAQTAQHKVTYSGAVPMCGVMGDRELYNYTLGYNVAAYHVAGIPATSFPFPNHTQGLASIKTALWTNYDGNKGAMTAQGEKLKFVLMHLSGGPRPIFNEAFASFQELLLDYGNRGGDWNGIFAGNAVNTSAIVYQLDANSALSPDEAAFNQAIFRILGDFLAQNPIRSDGVRAMPLVEGKFNVPVVTLHTLGDLFVPFAMQQIYRKRAEANGNSQWLVQRAVRATAHCDFNGAEMTAAFDAMVNWATNGVKPAGDDVLDPAVVAHPNYGCTYTVVTRQGLPACT